jgi:hypothetical protein
VNEIEKHELSSITQKEHTSSKPITPFAYIWFYKDVKMDDLTQTTS